MLRTVELDALDSVREVRQRRLPRHWNGPKTIPRVGQLQVRPEEGQLSFGGLVLSWHVSHHGSSEVRRVSSKQSPRDDTAMAIKQCKDAGIKVYMVTGDHPSTAAAIGRQIGLIGQPEQVYLSAISLYVLLLDWL